MTGWRDDKIDVDLRTVTAWRVSWIRPEKRSSANPWRACWALRSGTWCHQPTRLRCFEPHVVRALGELEAKLLLDLRPDLVLVQLTPSLAPGQSHDQSTWPGGWGQGSCAFANPVDNLGSRSPFISSCSSLARRSLNYLLASTGSTEAHRFQPWPFGVCGKNGPDFHRLAGPTQSKSTIRSDPKHGSGTVRYVNVERADE